MDEVLLLVALGASVFYIAFSMKYKTLLLERKFQEQVLDLDKKLARREKQSSGPQIISLPTKSSKKITYREQSTEPIVLPQKRKAPSVFNPKLNILALENREDQRKIRKEKLKHLAHRFKILQKQRQLHQLVQKHDRDKYMTNQEIFHRIFDKLKDSRIEVSQDLVESAYKTIFTDNKLNLEY